MKLLAAALLLALLFLTASMAQAPAYDQWQALAQVWNPFAEKMNRGVIDMKQWKKVVQEVDRIEGRKCKSN